MNSKKVEDYNSFNGYVFPAKRSVEKFLGREYDGAFYSCHSREGGNPVLKGYEVWK